MRLSRCLVEVILELRQRVGADHARGELNIAAWVEPGDNESLVIAVASQDQSGQSINSDWSATYAAQLVTACGGRCVVSVAEDRRIEARLEFVPLSASVAPPTPRPLFAPREGEGGAASSVRAVPAVSAQEQPAPDSEECKGTVLVVEDDAALRTITKGMLRAMGYTVVIAEDGADAQTVFDKHADEIDVVLLDLVLPRADGVAVFRHIRAAKVTTPIILTSGHASDPAVSELLEAGVVAFLQKPYGLATLSSCLRRVMGSASGTPASRCPAGRLGAWRR